jgi:hypothetical protein
MVAVTILICRWSVVQDFPQALGQMESAFRGTLPAPGYRSCSVGRISISFTATCRGRVTM